MRYTIRYYNGKDIINDSHTNCYDTAINRERELQKIYEREDIWIADAVEEILVG